MINKHIISENKCEVNSVIKLGTYKIDQLREM